MNRDGGTSNQQQGRPKWWCRVIAGGMTIGLALTAPAMAGSHSANLWSTSMLSVATAGVSSSGGALAKAAANAISSDADIVDSAGMKLQVSAKGRRLFVSGTVATIHDRHRVVELAEGVTGVTAIGSSIRIKPANVPDAAALESTATKAVRDAGAAGGTFAVRVKAGVAQLNGQVTSEWAAVSAVRRIPGILAIGGFDAEQPGRQPPAMEGALETVALSPAQDAALQKRVEEAMVAAGLSLKPEVKGGVVTLRGNAPDMSSGMRAPTIASRVPGVRGVKNLLMVPARAFKEGESRPDGEIESSVRRAIRPVRNIEIRVQAGRVYLTGRTTSADAAMAAIGAAANVSGVQEVVSALSYPVLGS